MHGRRKTGKTAHKTKPWLINNSKTYEEIGVKDYSAEDEKKDSPMTRLPDEILLLILKYFKPVELVKIRGVCSKWRDTIDNSDVLWVRHLKRDYNFSLYSIRVCRRMTQERDFEIYKYMCMSKDKCKKCNRYLCCEKTRKNESCTLL